MSDPRRRAPLKPQEALRPAIAKDFSGGLNTYDSPLNLTSKYVIEGTNVYPDSSGRLRVRYGTSLFADLSGFAGVTEIIGIEYYINALIAVANNGEVFKITGDATVTPIWNTTIAAALPGAPSAWSTGIDQANFAQFGGNLIIVNGVDKPLIVDPAFTVNYLADLGTNSNVNVPRARFVVTHNNYLVMAVTPTESTKLYITNRGTSGTFFGDPDPNDAVIFDTSTYITRGVPEITGLGSFRDKLIVTFDENIMPMTLGVYDEDAHKPTVTDVIENHGAISHRCIVALGDDIVFLDKAGIASVQRALITATLTPARESLLVSKDLQAALAKFSSATLSAEVFAVHDRLANQVLFFIPKDAVPTPTSDNHVYVFCSDKSQKFRAMAYYEDMPYKSGTRSADGRVFLTRSSYIYYYRNQYEPLFTDLSVPGGQPWSDDTTWSDGTLWYDTGDDASYTGNRIAFAISTPWSDFKAPEKVKASRYLHLVMEGSGAIGVQMFTDRFPQVQMSMAFGQSLGPMAPGIYQRPLNNDQLYAWNHTFTRMRLRVFGTTGSGVALISLGLLYLEGGYRR